MTLFASYIKKMRWIARDSPALHLRSYLRQTSNIPSKASLLRQMHIFLAAWPQPCVPPSPPFELVPRVPVLPLPCSFLSFSRGRAESSYICCTHATFFISFLFLTLFLRSQQSEFHAGFCTLLQLGLLLRLGISGELVYFLLDPRPKSRAACHRS